MSAFFRKIEHLLSGARRPSRLYTDVPVGGRSLMHFHLAENKKMHLTFDDGTRNILVLGATGAGKTEGVMIPALRALIKSESPGLVLDVKGDYTDFLMRECPPDRLHVIGPGMNTKPINLLAGFSLEMLEAFLAEMRNSASSKDSYWGSMAVQDLMLVAQFVREAEGRAPTIADLYDALVSPTIFCTRFDNWTAHTGPSLSLRPLLERCLSNRFGLLFAGRSKHTGFADYSDHLEDQYTWHIQHLVPHLARFSSDSVVREKLCAVDSINFEEAFYEQNRIILLDMPADMFGSASFVAARLLRINAAVTIMGKAIEYKHLRLGKDKYSFFLMDEFQQYVNARHGSAAGGVPDDNTWFDRSRSFGHINIVATHGISSFMAQCEESVANSIIQNFRNIIFLPSIDRRTVELINMIGGEKAKATVLHPERVGQGFLYCANSKWLNGRSVAIPIQTPRPSYKPQPASRKRFLNLKSEHDQYANFDESMSDAKDQQLPDRFGYFDSAVNTIHLVTTTHSRAYGDFIHALSKSACFKRGVWKCLPRIIRHDVKEAADPANWIRVAEAANFQSCRGDILVITRGGGEISSDEFKPFNDLPFVKMINAISKNQLTVSAIGHADDQFALDKATHINSSTPTQAAHDIAEVILDRDDVSQVEKKKIKVRRKMAG